MAALLNFKLEKCQPFHFGRLKEVGNKALQVLQKRPLSLLILALLKLEDFKSGALIRAIRESGAAYSRET